MNTKEIINILLSKRQERGALTVQEQDQLCKAFDSLQNEQLIWQAWLNDFVLGEGKTEKDAVKNAVKQYDTDIGFDTDDNVDDFIGKLDVFLKED